MIREKVVSNYSGLLLNELVVFAGSVVQSLQENEFFPNPTPAMAILQELSEDYRLKQETASNGGSVRDRRRRDASREQLLEALSQLAHYVNSMARGNPVQLTSTGLVLQKHAESVISPDVIRAIKLRDGALSGQLRVNFQAQRNILEYEIQIGQCVSEDAAVHWGESFFSTSSQGIVLAGLYVGQRYYIRVRGRNRRGNGDWSDYASLIVR